MINDVTPTNSLIRLGARSRTMRFNGRGGRGMMNVQKGTNVYTHAVHTLIVNEMVMTSLNEMKPCGCFLFLESSFIAKR